MIRVEWHPSGPRVRILGVRLHHWQAGAVLLFLGLIVISLWFLAVIALGSWLVWDDRRDLTASSSPPARPRTAAVV